MKIAEINNHHKIFNTILWQYEKSPRINAWVSALSDFSYSMCGSLFDEIMNGLVNLYTQAGTMARSFVQSLIGAIGFDWSSVADVGGVINCIMNTRFFGVANFDEFHRMAEAYGFGYSISQNSDGGRVILDITPSSVTLKSMWDSGISIPLSTNQAYTDTTNRFAFCFSDSTQYPSMPDESPRLGTKLELSYSELGTSSLEDVISGIIWSF